MADRILVVDDEIEMREVLTTMLTRSGYSVETAEGGREAIGAYIESLENKKPFAAIILDIMMPKGDGLQAVEIIRKEEEKRDIQCGMGTYIVMLTALENPWVEAFNKGCDDYLIKPYKMEDLLEKLQSNLERKKEKQQKFFLFKYLFVLLFIDKNDNQ